MYTAFDFSKPVINFMISRKLPAFCLFLVAASWGLTFPLIESSMHTQDPLIFVALRFSVAALPVLPYFLKNLTKPIFIAGCILGIVHCGAFIFQTIGLQTLSASRAAFITGIYVLMIPFLSPLFKAGRPGKKDFLSAIACCAGIYILTGCNIGQFSIGDLWILICDVFIAISIIYIGILSKNDVNPFMLAYTQIVMTGVFAWIPCFFFSNWNFGPFFTTDALTSLLVCSIVATVVAIALQSKYQKYVSIQATALIFSTEPVFAAFFDSIAKKSLPQGYVLLGGAIILASILYLELTKAKEAPPTLENKPDNKIPE